MNTRTKTALIGAVLAMALGAASPAVLATEVTYDFSGVADVPWSGVVGVPPEWANAPNLTYSGSVTIDTEAIPEPGTNAAYDFAVLDFTLNVNGLELAYHSPRDGVYTGAQRVLIGSYAGGDFAQIYSATADAWLTAINSNFRGYLQLEYQSTGPTGLAPAPLETDFAELGAWRLRFGIAVPPLWVWNAHDEGVVLTRRAD
jgi:hypothetical protein